jgi:hypothetical protein
VPADVAAIIHPQAPAATTFAAIADKEWERVLTARAQSQNDIAEIDYVSLVFCHCSGFLPK